MRRTGWHRLALGLVVLRLNEWPGYVSMHKAEFEAFAKAKGVEVSIEVVKPDITDDLVIAETLRKGGVDVLTPTEAFMHSHDDELIKLLAPVDPAKVPGYERVSESLRNSSYHRSGDKHYGIVFMAGYYGLYFNTAHIKDPPKNWDLLWKPEMKKKYSVSKETYFVNTYVASWVMDGKNIEHAYDIMKLNKDKMAKKVRELAVNAHHLWVGIGNTPEELKTIDYTASWGFELGPEWQLAFPGPGSSMWVDALSITTAAAKDPDKLKAYYLLASFLVQPESQEMFRKTLRALPLTVSGPMDLPQFDSRFFWRPMDTATSNGLLAMWEAAIKGLP